MLHYDVIVLGGSFAGLSAALTLARFKVKVLVLDSVQPCNKNVEKVYNLLGQDGKYRAVIMYDANRNLGAYKTVDIRQGIATELKQNEQGWKLSVGDQYYIADRILFCTGITDYMPSINGIQECWGKSVVHCPYCHAYEMEGAIGLLGDGQHVLATARLLSRLDKNILVFTNGISSFTQAQIKEMGNKKILWYEEKIIALQHCGGKLSEVQLSDGRMIKLNFLFINTDITQQSSLPKQAGCELTHHGLLMVNEYQETTVKGIYAAGDCANSIRYAAVAIADGTIAASFILQDILS